MAGVKHKMCVKIIFSLLILVYVKADDDVVLPYHEVAYTTSGAPCIGGCSPETHQCVASWPPKNEPCILHSAPAPRFLTTQAQTQHKYCLSNCGYYEWDTPWCFVTSDGEWDYCTPQDQQAKPKDKVLPYTMVANTITGKPCIGGCSPDTHQCVAHWPPKNEPCVIYGTPARTFYTTQTRTHYSTCLSNCASFSWKSPWCYVTSDGEYDDCSTEEQKLTVTTQKQEVAVTTQKQKVAVTTQEHKPAVTTQEQQPSVTTQQQEVTVTTQKQEVAVTTQEQKPTVTTQEQQPSVTTQQQEVTVTTERQVIVTTEQQVTVTTKHPSPDEYGYEYYYDFESQQQVAKPDSNEVRPFLFDIWFNG